MKKAIALFLALTVVFALSSCGGYAAGTEVYEVAENGDAMLAVMPQKVLEDIGIGETAEVRIGWLKLEMPLVDELIAEEGKLQLYCDKSDFTMKICIFGGNFCDTYNVSEGDKVKIFKVK